MFFDQPSFDDVWQLSQFLGCVEPQRLLDLAEVSFSEIGTSLSYPWSRELSKDSFYPPYWLIVCLTFPSPRLQLSLMTHICQQIPPFLSSVRTLEIDVYVRPLGNDENVAQWLDLLHVFNRVENLRIVGEASPNFAHALQLVSVEMAANVLPALRELILDRITSESWKDVTSFIDTRKLAGLPAIKFIISRM